VNGDSIEDRITSSYKQQGFYEFWLPYVFPFHRLCGAATRPHCERPFGRVASL